MIKFAETVMIPALMAMWQECFGDEEAFIQFYFAQRFQKEEVLVWLDEEQIPQGMLSMLPASTYDGNGECLLYYIYAVATREGFRGRGISSQLLNYAKELARAKGAGLFLIPATPSLYDFYGKRGFTTDFFITEKEYPVKGIPLAAGIQLLPLTGGEYQNLRRHYLPEAGSVFWDEAALTYVIGESRFLGGFADKVIINDGTDRSITGAVIGYQKEDALFIREILVPEALRAAVIKAVAVRQGCSSARVRLPVWEDGAAGKQAFAMGFALPSAEERYLNLALE